MDVPRPDAAKRIRRRRATIAGAIAAALAAGGAGLATLETGAPRVERRALHVDTVQEGELVRRVRGPGLLVPRDQSRIAAAVDGRVERVLLRPGAEVVADTVIVELSSPDLQQLEADARWALDAGRAELAALKVKLHGELLEQRARIAEAQAAHDSARLEAEADAKLVVAGLVPGLKAAHSKIAVEQLTVRLEVERERLTVLEDAVRAQVAAQAARLEQLRRAHERRREQVEALQVRAGMAGVLQTLTVEPGQRIGIGTEIARVASPGKLRAELRIPELDARDLAVGQAAVVDTRNGIVEGRVERVDPTVREGAVAVDVALTGALPEGARADLAVDGVVEIERLGNVRHVARPVNVRSDGPASLFRLEQDGQARRVQVRLGKASVDRVVVLEGLSPGDRVIVSDLSEFSKQDRLEVK